MRTSCGLASCLLLFLAVGCSDLPERGDDDAVLSVGEPTVFRRERSLVERFEDLEWLRLQRSPEKEKEYEQEFQGSSRTASAEFTGFALKAAIGEALAAPAAADPGDGSGTDSGSTSSSTSTAATASDADGSAGDASNPDTRAALAALGTIPDAALGQALDRLNAASPKLLPRDRFANRVAFRDTVAEAIRRRSLDDVHDLAGLTLYELQFDLTLMAGENAGHPHVVVLDVGEATSSDFLDAHAVFNKLRTKCLAWIESASASLASGRASIDESQEIGESILRGVFAARYEDMRRLAAAAEPLENLQRESCKVLEQPEMKRRVARLAESGLLTPDELRELSRLTGVCALPRLEELGAQLATWQGQLRSHAAVLGALVTCERVETASTEITRMNSACDEYLAQITIRHPDVMALSKLLGRILEAWRQSGLDDTEANDLARRSQRALVEYKEKLDRVGAIRFEATTASVATDYGHFDEVPTRTAQSQKDFEAMLASLESLQRLDQVAIDDLRKCLRVANADEVREHAQRAIGFVIARVSATASGGALEYRETQIVEGLDVRTLLPVLLVANVDRLREWQRMYAERTRVVGVTPTEMSEQFTSSAQSDIRSAFSAVLDGVFRGSVASANAAFERATQELRRYELIARNPIVVGFVGGDVRKGAPSNSFGWVIGPRLETTTEGRAGLRYRSSASHHAVSACIVAPASADSLTLNYRVFRIEDSGRWTEAKSIEQCAPKAPDAAPCTITVRLPRSVDTIANAFLAEHAPGATKPKLSPDQSWRVQADEKCGLTILGAELWRNPQVYVDGQRATRVQILSDLGGLWAEFEKLRPLAGQEEGSVKADLVVSTSRGTDLRRGAVEVLAPRKQKKAQEPSLEPSVQVVVPRPSDGGKKATVDLRFTLAPPLPQARHEVVAVVRRKNAASGIPIVVPPDLIATDPQKPNELEIRGLVVPSADPWATVDGFDVVLKVRDNEKSDLRALHPKPAEVVLVALPIVCQPLAADPLRGSLVEGRWKLVDATTIEVATNPRLEPGHHDLFIPELASGTPVAARAWLGGAGESTVKIQPKAGEVGRVWRIELPKGAILVSTNPQAIPAETELVVEVGKARFQIPRIPLRSN